MRKFLLHKALFLTLSTSLIFVAQVASGNIASDSPATGPSEETGNYAEVYQQHQKEDKMTTLKGKAKATKETVKEGVHSLVEKSKKGADTVSSKVKSGTRATKRGAKKVLHRTEEAIETGTDKAKDIAGI